MKLSEDTKIGLVVGSAMLLVFSICLALLLSMPTVKDTQEYKEGRLTGYTEHNETKYKAAEKIAEDWLLYGYEQSAYAEGYCAGYNYYWNEQRDLEWKAERNETLRTLGI